MEKNEWSEPELIVLVRNKPEEVLLVACKYIGATSGSTPLTGDNHCTVVAGCDFCTGLEGS
jgi:hypothetical protein